METIPKQDNTMSSKDKVDILKYSVSRFDAYAQAVNSKIALYITLNTFILTASIAGARSIISQFGNNTNLPILFLTLVVVMSAVSIFCTIKASIPYLNTDSDTIFYFGYIACLSSRDYQAKIDALDFDKTVDDLSCQARTIAIGLRNKFSSLKIAGYILLADFSCIAILSLLLITKA